MPPLVLAICLDLLLFLRELGVIILQKSACSPWGQMEKTEELKTGQRMGSLKTASSGVKENNARAKTFS